MHNRLILIPRASRPDRLQIWLGAFGDSAPTFITWKINGEVVTPEILRTLQPGHDHGARCWTGTFEFQSFQKGTNTISAMAQHYGQAELAVRPIPKEVPKDDWLRILLVSCYYHPTDSGRVANFVNRIPTISRPHFTILMGDQVYLDLPSFLDFPDDEARLSNIFERKYTTNWTQSNGLLPLLQVAPVACMPDDHEYWNNFPHASPVVQNSWTQPGRTRWKNAANALYDAFQTSLSSLPGDLLRIDIPPVSVLILNQRRFRLENKNAALCPDGLVELRSWAESLVETGSVGILATGQPILDTAAGKIGGAFFDYKLPNYGDYAELLNVIVSLADAGPSVILVSGDVHWGRVSEVQSEGHLLLYEVITSPSSLVQCVGVDDWRTTKDAIGVHLRGERSRWPLHAQPSAPPDYVGAKALGPRKLRCRMLEPGHTGNQLATLCIRRSAGSVEAKVIYHDLHDDPYPDAVHGPWRLRRQDG